MDSREIFSKEPLTNDSLINAAINAFGVKEDEILVVERSEDWLKRNNRPIIFEVKGQLDKEEEYPEYYYYDIFFDIPILDKLISLKKEFNTPDLVITN